MAQHVRMHRHQSSAADRLGERGSSRSAVFYRLMDGIHDPTESLEPNDVRSRVRHDRIDELRALADPEVNSRAFSTRKSVKTARAARKHSGMDRTVRALPRWRRAWVMIKTTRLYRQSDKPHVMWHTVKAPCQASSSGREGDSAASDTDPDVRRRETSRHADSSEKPARQPSPRAVAKNALRSSVAALAFLGTAQ
jgi:hypothetical protein